jgi:p-aminobenzoyl-glutamate transporter AbgT
MIPNGTITRQEVPMKHLIIQAVVALLWVVALASLLLDDIKHHLPADPLLLALIAFALIVFLVYAIIAVRSRVSSR